MLNAGSMNQLARAVVDRIAQTLPNLGYSETKPLPEKGCRESVLADLLAVEHIA
jgi:hypothetical protein